MTRPHGLLRRPFPGLAVACALLSLLAEPALCSAASSSPWQAALSKLAADSTRPLVVRRAPGAPVPSFVAASIPVARFSAAATSTEQARDFWAAYGQAFGVRDPGSELVLRSAVTDRLGMTHLRYDQRYEGLAVFGRQLVLHFDRSTVTAINGEFATDVEAVTTPLVSAAEAVETAGASLASRRARLHPAPPTLLVYAGEADRPRLAWLVNVPTHRPLGFWRVFVDALTGAVLSSYDDLQTAKNRFTYTNGNDPDCNNSGSPLCVLPGALVRMEAEPASGDAVIDAAHDSAGIVYDYYSSAFGRDSYDGAGHAIRSTAHFGLDFNNAAWCADDCASSFGSFPDGEQMIYGDGDGTVFSPLSQGLDVVAHELTHAVTGSTANLTYQGQSGALNESYSDVFAVMVDTEDFLVGEDVFTPGVPGDALRSLEDPALFGQPAHMSEFVHTVYDNGGVHINSGIPNKVAYLITADPTYGIGRSDTQQIYYRALTLYLTPSSDFLANLNVLLQSAQELFGTGGPQAQAVLRAHAAVGLVLRPTVAYPNGGELLQQGSPVTILWDPAGAVESSFRVEFLQDLGSASYSQNFEAGPALPPEFGTGGDLPWFVDTFEPGSGARSAGSGLIGDGQRSELSLTTRMTAAGDVSFRARVSSEFGFDVFSFHVDGVLRLVGHGNVAWQFVSVPVGAGTHTFTWIYEKSFSGSAGFDRAWIDDLLIPGAENVVATTINPSTAAGEGSQMWTPPAVSAANFRVRVRTLDAAPWLASDDSDGLFTIGDFVAATVSGIDPDSGPSAGGTSVSVSGANFQPGATLTIGGSAASGVSVGSPVEITALTPALSPGTLHDVAVTNPGASAGTLVKGWLADFLDMPGGHALHDWVEKLFRNGVTAGCGSGNFCAGSPNTRGQMAVFLLKAKEGSGYLPPACVAGAEIFDDVPAGNPFCRWIEELSHRGITAGCSPGNYCPGAAVNRAQMSVFLLKTLEGSGYLPAACVAGAEIFDDVAAGNPFCRWIEELSRRSITAGCNPDDYCPGNTVTRGQMAVFLVKTFALP